MSISPNVFNSGDVIYYFEALTHVNYTGTLVYLAKIVGHFTDYLARWQVPCFFLQLYSKYQGIISKDMARPALFPRKAAKFFCH